MWLMMLMPFSAALAFLMIAVAVSSPSTGKAKSRRVESIRVRHGSGGTITAQAQLRRIQGKGETRLDAYVYRLLPNPDKLRQRLAQTGKEWSLGQFMGASALLASVLAGVLLFKGAPVLLALFVGLAVGFGLPHKAIGILIKRRVNKFTAKFPDAIELLVRGLRSGLPISETLNIVGAEVPGPVGVEFRLIADRIKIGRTMEAALQETADRLGTPEFQFFTITLAIQRETGGNLAETLSNLAEVLRKRAQMKLKIRAMSSESKASAYIVGSLPFFVFGAVWFVNYSYIGQFFVQTRLMIAGSLALVWMAIGAFIMAKMVSFEI
ncbi:type II secretion system F family protein [Sphingomonas sp.]|uniref:type II secretion system F family protein n=1 Tax=Sphingomonas sp. TaxID=28214 RepID=UPI003AFFE55E